MSFIFKLYDQQGIEEKYSSVFVEDHDADQLANSSILIDGRPYYVVRIIRDSQVEGLDDPIDVVQIRLKLN